MSATHLKAFLKALDSVKQDYECVVCLELCKNPVTLSKCFHLICSEHFSGLKVCPKCNTSLDGCTTYLDDRLQSCIDSAKQLDHMFKDLRPNKELQTSADSTTSNRKGGKPTDVVIKYQDIKNKLILRKNSINKENISKNDANTSVLSNFSANLNKNLEKRNNKGETPLHIACRLGKIAKVVELLQQGANTNTKDNAGWTPLHEAAQNGRLDLVQLLLQYNALINVPGQSNETPLHEAIRYEHTEIVNELVRNGADIDAKNNRGETPIQLAKGTMKEVIETAMENIIQTQTANVTLISEMHSELDYENMKIYCASSYRTAVNKLKVLSKHHANINIEAKFTKKVTHLIVDATDGICDSSVDVLQGIVSGLWILSSAWITDSTEEKLEPFPNYEIVGVGNKSYNGPRNARYNKYKQLPGIFDGCHFYFHNFTSKYEISKNVILTKAILTKLVTDAGGVVLRRVPNPELIPEAEQLVPYHAKKNGKLTTCSHYIIFKDMYEPMYNMTHVKALPIGWFIECLEKYELCEPW